MTPTIELAQSTDVEAVDTWSPERMLAAAVLQLAVTDALQHPSPAERQRARDWLLLADSSVEFWCLISGLRFVAFREGTRRALACV